MRMTALLCPSPQQEHGAGSRVESKCTPTSGRESKVHDRQIRKHSLACGTEIMRNFMRKSGLSFEGPMERA